MSFSSDVKNEITQKKLPKNAAALAACYAFACFGKVFDEHNLVLQSELEAVAQYARKVFAICGATGAVEAIPRANGAVYELRVCGDELQKLHALLHTTGTECSLQINPALLPTAEAVRAFVASAFLCAGTMTDPQKEYNLEYTTARHNLAKDFEALLAQYEFSPHRTCRKGTNVVYIKASACIEDLLAFMGAGNASIEIMNQKLFKSIRNQSNRLTNCDTANMSKTAAANAQTMKAIRYLQGCGAFDTLPESLKEAAYQRMEHPDAPLAQLAQGFTPPISKSGLSHRMKKIELLAATLQAQQEQIK